MAMLSTTQLQELESDVQNAPADVGSVEMIVRRPDVGEREVLDEGTLLVGEGLAGDNYVARGSSKTDDGKSHPEAQINIMRSRAVDAVADGDRERWALAGDQLFVDFDLNSEGQLPR